MAIDLNGLRTTSKNDKTKNRRIPEKIVKGDTASKEKSTGQKVLESVMAEDFNTIKTHVVKKVIDPSIREIIFNSLKDVIELALFGMDGRASRSRGTTAHTSYGSYHSSSPSSSSRESRRSTRPATEKKYAAYKLGEIEFEFEEDAIHVLDYLCSDIADYGDVSGEVLCKLLGWESTYIDRQYGWSDLGKARIDRIRGGHYILTLPKAEVIE